MIVNISLSVLSGLFIALSLPNFYIPFSFLIGFYILFNFVTNQNIKFNILYSLIIGLSFSMLSFYWIVYAISYYGGLNIFLSYILFTIFSLSYAIFVFVIFQVVLKIGYIRYGYRVFYLAPFLWVIFEFMREFFPFNGFPWNLAGYMLSYINPFAQFTAIFSIYGLSFLAISSSAILFLFMKKKDKTNFSLLIISVVIFSALFLGGSYRINSYNDTGRSVKVAIIQGNIDESFKLRRTYETDREIIDKYIRLMEDSLKYSPDIIILPESAIPIYPYIDTSLREYFFEKIKNIRKPLIIGFDNVILTPYKDVDKVYNSVFLIDENHRYLDIYNKIKLVPFGEYAPFRNRFLEDIFTYLQGVDFTKGDRQNIINYKDLKIVCLVCFESVFADFVSDFVQKGGNLIVNITNDGWFGKTSGPLQHFEMARIRAIENGIYLVRAANTGISAVINPVGSVNYSIPLMKEGYIVSNVYLSDNRTFFSLYRKYIYLIFIFIFLSTIIYFELKYKESNSLR